MNSLAQFFYDYRDAITFSLVLLAGYAGAVTHKEILRDRFKAIHKKEYLAPSERENPKDRYMCNRCWVPYPCDDLKLLGVKK